MTDVLPADSGGENLDQLINRIEADLAQWEARVAAKEDRQFTVSLGDIEAVGDIDGHMLALWLDESVRTYSEALFEQRMNMAMKALRDKAIASYDPDALLHPTTESM